MSAKALADPTVCALITPLLQSVAHGLRKLSTQHIAQSKKERVFLGKMLPLAEHALSSPDLKLQRDAIRAIFIAMPDGLMTYPSSTATTAFNTNKKQKQKTPSSPAAAVDEEEGAHTQGAVVSGDDNKTPSAVASSFMSPAIDTYEKLLQAELALATIVDPMQLLKSHAPTATTAEINTKTHTNDTDGTAAAASADDTATAERKETVDATSSAASSLSIADRIRAAKFAVWQGDMSILACDAVVNPANNALLGCFLPSHKCLDNILHGAAGPNLRVACKRMLSEELNIDEDENGQCRVTDAFCLPSRYVFHTVGPNLSEGFNKPPRYPPTTRDERELRSCYRKCLEKAIEMNLKSIAFCCISTGIFAYPADEAAAIAVEETTQVMLEAFNSKKSAATAATASSEDADDAAIVASLPVVIFNVFKDEDLEIYNELLP